MLTKGNRLNKSGDSVSLMSSVLFCTIISMSEGSMDKTVLTSGMVVDIVVGDGDVSNSEVLL